MEEAPKPHAVYYPATAEKIEAIRNQINGVKAAIDRWNTILQGCTDEQNQAWKRLIEKKKLLIKKLEMDIVKLSQSDAWVRAQRRAGATAAQNKLRL